MEIYQNLSIEDLPNEVWKDIPNYEGLYQVSNLGRVKSLGREKEFGIGRYKREPKILTPIKDGRGYYIVNLRKNNRPKVMLIHRLVAQVFIPNPNKFRCIDHINTIKSDNRAENLRWCTHSMNMRNPITKNRLDNLRQTYCNEPWYVEKQRRAQQTNKSVAKLDVDGNVLEIYYSISEAARQNNTSVQAVSRCCNGTVKTSNGYIWKFI